MSDTFIYKQMKKEFTDRVKSVFGDDIVKDVFISTVDYKSHTDTETRRILFQDEIRLMEMNEKQPDGKIRCDGEYFIIEFSNGKMVELGNSEWACMFNVDLTANKYKQI